MGTADRFKPLNRGLTCAYGQVDEKECSLIFGCGGDVNAAWGSKDGLDSAGVSAGYVVPA